MIPINETETKTFVHGTLADSSIFRRSGSDFLPLDGGTKVGVLNYFKSVHSTPISIFPRQRLWAMSS
jgi:hypothetical protein